MNPPGPDDLARFEAGEMPLDQFSHREHVRIGFELLRRYSFIEAAQRFAAGLRALTARAGKDGVYHETITIAFLALIGERLAVGRCDDFAAFEDANPDLLRKGVLDSRYSPARLASAAARATFLLPDRT